MAESENTQTKTLILIDDHNLMRVGIKDWIQNNSDWKVKFEASSKAEVEKIIPEIARLKTDENNKVCAVVDLSFQSDDGMSAKSGFEIIREIKEANNEIKCIVFSSYESAGYIEKALSSAVGASGYVSKSSSEKILLEAIEKISIGEVYIEQKFFRNLLEIRTLYEAFTKTERKIINMISENLTNEQIAEKLNIQKRSVENHISHLYEKAGVKGKEELLEKLGFR